MFGERCICGIVVLYNFRDAVVSALMKENQVPPAPNTMVTSLSQSVATPRSMTPSQSVDSTMMASSIQAAEATNIVDHSDINLSLIDSLNEVKYVYHFQITNLLFFIPEKC